MPFGANVKVLAMTMRHDPKRETLPTLAGIRQGDLILSDSVLRGGSRDTLIARLSGDGYIGDGRGLGGGPGNARLR
jgi:hypothetical protein